MSEWDDRLRDHDVNGRLREFETVLGSVVETPDNAESVARARRVEQHLAQTIAVLEPMLVRIDAMNRIAEHLRQSSALVVDYNAIPDAATLDAVHRLLDEALQEIQTVPSAVGPETDRLREAAIRYQQSVAQRLNSIEKRAEEVDTTLVAAEADLADLKQGIVTKVGEAETRIVAEFAPIDTRVKALVESAETQTRRLDTATAAYQTTFQDAEAKRQEAHGLAVTKAREDVDDLIRTSTQRLDDESTRIAVAADQTLTAMAGHETQARRLVSTTASLTVAGGYLNYANGERLVKYLWQFLAAVAIAVVAIYGFESLGVSRPVDLNIQWLAGRLLVTLPLLGFVLLAVSLANRAARNERRARSTEMDLRALDPYIELLPEGVRTELKAELARRAFFRIDEDQTSGDAPSVKDAVDKAFEVAKEAVKR